MNSYTILATLQPGQDVAKIKFFEVKAASVEGAAAWTMLACSQLGVKLADNHAGRPDISILRDNQPDAIRSAIKGA